MSANPAIIGDEFKRGFHRQTNWSWSMATAFFFGESGAGLFLVSLFYDFFPGLLAGLLLTALGKTAGHLLHLGQPARAWRAILKLNSSWVSRGLLAIIVFTGCGALYLLHLAGLTFGLMPAWLAPVLGALAGAAALVIMLYQGLAMSHSPAIALWSTGIMPLLSLTYAALAGVALALAMGAAETRVAVWQGPSLLQGVELGLMFYLLIMHFSLLHAARYGAQGARKSAELLLRGSLARAFLGVVILVGLLVPLALLAMGLEGGAGTLFISACVLAGYYAFRVAIFKAGVYDPPQSFTPRLRRF